VEEALAPGQKLTEATGQATESKNSHPWQNCLEKFILSENNYTRRISCNCLGFSVLDTSHAHPRAYPLDLCLFDAVTETFLTPPIATAEAMA
jgi:hypothetical protein